jgi:hypothetical protein
MKIIRIVLSSLTLAFSPLALASGDKLYFMNPGNESITIHYVQCNDADPRCSNSKIADAVIAPKSYVIVTLDGPSANAPYGQQYVRTLGVDAFGSSMTFTDATGAYSCGINPRTNLNAIKFERFNDTFNCLPLFVRQL